MVRRRSTESGSSPKRRYAACTPADDDPLALELPTEQLVELGAPLGKGRHGAGGGGLGRYGGRTRTAPCHPLPPLAAQHSLDLLSNPLQHRKNLRHEVLDGLPVPACRLV